MHRARIIAVAAIAAAAACKQTSDHAATKAAAPVAGSGSAVAAAPVLPAPTPAIPKPAAAPTPAPPAPAPAPTPAPTESDEAFGDDDPAPSPAPSPSPDPSSPSPAPSPPPDPSSPSPSPSPSAAAAGGATFDLRPIRTFDALDPNAQQTQDGDFMTWKQPGDGGNRCGSLYKTTPYEAIFILCADHVVAGPLTTNEQITGVFTQLRSEMDAYFKTQSDMSRAAFNIGRNIRANWPTGCSSCKYRVYDGSGNYLRDE